MKNPFTFLENNRTTALILMIAIAVTLRTIFTIAVYSKSGTSGWSDDLYYLYVGEQIAEGNWSPQFANRTEIIVGPTLPMLIALFKILFNNPIIPFFIYNILLTSLMVPVLYFLGKELFNAKVGWVMAIWGMFFMEAFKYSPHLLKESTLFLFVPLTLLLLVRSIKRKECTKYILLAALSFSWLIHTDERFLVYLPYLGLIFLFSMPIDRNRVMRSFSIWVLAGLLLMLPWTIRNCMVFDQLVILTPRTTAFTSKLWGGNLEPASSHFTHEGSRKNLIESQKERALELGDKHGKVPYEYGKREARIKAFQHFWQPTFINLHFIQYGFRTQKWSLRHNAVSMLFYGVFLPFYIIGFYYLIRRKHWLGLFIATIPIIHGLLHAYMIWPLERYRSPITFIVVMVGVWTAIEIVHCARRKWEGKMVEGGN